MGDHGVMMWGWRIIIIVPASAKFAAEQSARMINSTGPDYSGDAFTVPLSPNGKTPITHWALYTSATDDMVREMAEALPAIVGAMFWRHDANGSLAASNVSEAAGQPWDFAQSLGAAGLKPVVQSMP